jgi:hypothetical protein
MIATTAAIQAEESIVFVLNAYADEAFPLFSAKSEMEWDPDWRPEFVFPPTGDPSPDGGVFLVRGNDRESVWVMTVYDTAERRVQYVRVTPGHSVGQLWISVTPLQAAQSQVKVTYRLTGLSTTGNSFVEKWKTEFPDTVHDWEAVLNHYLRTGQPLRNRPYDVQES